MTDSVPGIPYYARIKNMFSTYFKDGYVHVRTYKMYMYVYIII